MGQELIIYLLLAHAFIKIMKDGNIASWIAMWKTVTYCLSSKEDPLTLFRSNTALLQY